MTEARKKRAWFQLRLSTLLAMSIFSGLLMWLTMGGKYRIMPTPTLVEKCLAMWGFATWVAIFGMAFEWWIRRRERRQG